MKRPPAALFIIDTRKEDIAVKEARTLGIPIAAVVDTNCDPDDADYIIPSNDDAIRAIKLFVSKIANACIEGRHIYQEKLVAGEIEKPVEEESNIIVERKVFVFKEFGEENEQEQDSTSVAVSEGDAAEGEKKEEPKEDA